LDFTPASSSHRITPCACIRVKVREYKKTHHFFLLWLRRKTPVRIRQAKKVRLIPWIIKKRTYAIFSGRIKELLLLELGCNYFISLLE
jgi:hypothetical protein